MVTTKEEDFIHKKKYANSFILVKISLFNENR